MDRRRLLTLSLLTGVSPLFASSKTGGKIRIGQIGTAHAHAGGKMSAMRGLSDLYEVVGIVEPDPERRKAAEKSTTYAGLSILTEEELLSTPNLAAVAVETEIAEAAATALRCLQAGKHVHLDKPGAMEHASFKKMRLEAQERGLTVQMGYMLRYNPAFEFLFKAVRAGWLGEITEIDAAMENWQMIAHAAP